jgi:hypothetical protein
MQKKQTQNFTFLEKYYSKDNIINNQNYILWYKEKSNVILFYDDKYIYNNPSYIEFIKAWFIWLMFFWFFLVLTIYNIIFFILSVLIIVLISIFTYKQRKKNKKILIEKYSIYKLKNFKDANLNYPTICWENYLIIPK